MCGRRNRSWRGEQPTGPAVEPVAPATGRLSVPPMRGRALWPPRARMSVPTISAGSIQALAASAHESSTAFQSVLVALSHAVARAAERVRAAEEAALSLAQRQKVAAVAEDLAHTTEALQGALSVQGRCLLGEHRSLRTRVKEAGERVRLSLSPKPEPNAASWWFALSEAVAALDEAGARIEALAAAQPSGSPGCAVGSEVGARLDAHRETLLTETERWVG